MRENIVNKNEKHLYQTLSKVQEYLHDRGQLMVKTFNNQTEHIVFAPKICRKMQAGTQISMDINENDKYGE